MSFEDKINDIIGKPYSAKEFHCYSLVEYLVEKAPKLEGTAKSLTCSVKHFKKELYSHSLEEVDLFKNKDIILLGRNNIFFHIGVFYNDGIVHATEDGVVYQSMATIKTLYQNIKGLRV